MKFLETMDKCLICLEELKQPKLLSCLHSFCAECLEHTMQAQHSNGAASLAPYVLRCPLCNTLMNLEQRHGDVNTIPDNVFFQIHKRSEDLTTSAQVTQHDQNVRTPEDLLEPPLLQCGPCALVANVSTAVFRVRTPRDTPRARNLNLKFVVCRIF